MPTCGKTFVRLFTMLLATIEERPYWSPLSRQNPQRSQHPPSLLPAFDEYNVAYKHRQLVNELMPKWNALGPTVIIDGKIVGTWKAFVNGSVVTIRVNPARSLKKSEISAVSQAGEQYAAFLGRTSATTEFRHTKL